MAAGGRREGAGRPPGSLNKTTSALREAAQGYTDEALATLAAIMRNEAQPAAARVSAAQGILDRAHGKPPQSVKLGGDDENDAPILQRVERVIVDPRHPDA